MTAVVVAINCRPRRDIPCEVAAHLIGYSESAIDYAVKESQRRIDSGQDSADAIREAVATTRNFYPPVFEPEDVA